MPSFLPSSFVSAVPLFVCQLGCVTELLPGRHYTHTHTHTHARTHLYLLSLDMEPMTNQSLYTNKVQFCEPMNLVYSRNMGEGYLQEQK